jgi:hypothetical protein
MAGMKTPAFFDAVPAITVADALAQALGAADGGLIEYRYVDAVKLAGHSCPTVAGAAGRFARNGTLRFGVPMRGEIHVTRLDDGRSVELSHRPQAVPRPAGLSELLRAASGPQACAAARRAFADAWQGWVRTIVIDHADDPALIQIAA